MGSGVIEGRIAPWYWLGVATLLVLAITLRLGAANRTVVDHPLRPDADDYYNYALNLKFHHVYSRTAYSKTSVPRADAVRAPGYPFWLVWLISYPPDVTMIMRITRVQTLLDCLTVLLTLAVSAT